MDVNSVGLYLGVALQDLHPVGGVGRGAGRFAGGLLDHYRGTLQEIAKTGYLSYCAREFRPYLQAAARQFSLSHKSLTERLLSGRKSGSSQS